MMNTSEPIYKGLPASLIVDAVAKGKESKFLESNVTQEFKKSMRGIPKEISETHMEAEIQAAESLSRKYCGVEKHDFCDAVRIKLGLRLHTCKEQECNERETKRLVSKIEDILGSAKRLAAAITCAMLIFNVASPAAAELNKVLTDTEHVVVQTGTGISAGGGTINSDKDIIDQEGKDILDNHGVFANEINDIRKSRVQEMKADAKEKMVKVFAEANNRLSQKTLNEYAGYMIEASEKYKISPFRLGGITIKESTLKKNARSSANALGLTQVMPSVHIEMLKKKFPNLIRKSTDLFNPKASIYAGALIYKMYEDAVGEKYVLHRYNGVKKKYWNNPRFSYKSKIERWEDRIEAAKLDDGGKFDWTAFNAVFDEAPQYTENEINKARYITGVEQIAGITETEKAYIAQALNVKDTYYSDTDKQKAEKIIASDLFMRTESSPLAMLYAKLSADTIHNAPQSLLSKMKLSFAFAEAKETGKDKNIFAAMKNEVNSVMSERSLEPGVYLAEQQEDPRETDERIGYGFKILIREEDIYGEHYDDSEPLLG